MESAGTFFSQQRRLVRPLEMQGPGKYKLLSRF